MKRKIISCFVVFVLLMLLPVSYGLENATEEVVEETTEEVVEEPTEEVIEEPTEEVIEEPTEEVVEEPTEEVVEETTEEVVEQPTEEVVEEPTEEVVEITLLIGSKEEKVSHVKNTSFANPKKPIKEGYRFIGWYEKTRNEEFNFSKPITKNTVLIAKFEEIPQVKTLSEQGVSVTGLFLKQEKLSVQITKAENGKLIYSLMIINADGEEVPLRELSTVRISIPNQENVENVVLKYDGEEYPSSYNNGILEFKTNHFSDWTILPKTAKIVVEKILPNKKYYGARKIKANIFPNYESTDEWWYMEYLDKFTVDGEVAFCVQPGVSTTDRNAEFINGNDYVNNNSGGQANFDLKKSSRIIYYGWTKSLKTKRDYIITQLVLWMDGIGNVVDYKDFTFNDLTMDQFWTARQAILNKVSKFDIVPSFNKTTINITAGESVTLTDTNNVIQDFEPFKADGLEFSVNQNKLTIKALNDKSNGKQVSTSKVKSNLIGVPIISTDSLQDVMVNRLSDPVRSLLRFKIQSLGELEVVKKGTNGELVPGTVFALYKGDKKITEKTTDKTGKVVFNGLEQGDYKIKEIDVPSPYILDQNSHSVSIKAGKKSTEIITNKKAQGQIILYKTEEGTKEPIQNASFEIRNSSGSVVQTITTNSEGIARSKALPLGKYTIIEKSVPSPYILDSTPHEINLEYKDQNTATVEKTLTIGNKTTTTEFSKKTLSGEELSGAKLQVINANGDVVEEWISGDKPHIIKGLPFGKYILHEDLAPLGFQVAQDVEFEILATGEIQSVEMIDELIEGTVKGVKKDQFNNPVEGAVYQILDENMNPIESLTTDKNGEFISSPLVYGTYYLKEVEAPEGYLIDSKLHEITIQENGKIVFQKLEEKMITSTIILTKEDTKTLERLAGAKFEVYNAMGELVFEGVTDENGQVKMTLKFGKYTYKEILAPKGYILAEKVGSFTVSKDGAIIEEVVFNEAIPVKGLPNTGESKSIPVILLGLVCVILGIYLSYKKQIN